MNKKIIKISIYNSHCTPSQVMQGNGDAILDNICISCITDEDKDTGEYYLDAIFLIDKEGLWEHIQEESILKVQMDYGEEYFRIAKITSNNRDITVFARQETIYQTLHMWLNDVRPENINGLSALTHMRDNCIGPKNIKVFSDISTISTAYYQDMNMYKALHDCDQSFINRWGGEIQRRGYNLTINKTIGAHRGVQIRSKKNLTGFEANTDMDNVFTRIKPKGFDGITIDGFVDSPLINNYPFIKTITITYDDVKVKDTDKEDTEGFNTLEEAQIELVRRANLEFSQKNIDKIQASYRVNFIQLEQTEEYKNYAAAERVFLGDSVDVYEDTLNIDITVRAIRRKYDVLRQRVIEIELSNEVVKKKPPTIGDIVNELDKIEDIINENDKWYTDAINNATDLIQNGLKDSYVIVRKNEIIIGDTQDINTMTNVWRFNRGGLGHSSTGYFGEFGTAITMDGSIVASFITTGLLNAALIKTGVLQSFNQKTWINMDNGTFNFADKIKFDGNNFTIDLSDKDLTTNEEVESKISQSANNIKNEVNQTLENNYATKSEVTQTAKDIRYEFKEFASFPNLIPNGCPSPSNYLETGWISQNAVIFPGYDNLGFYVYDGLAGEAIVWSPYVNVLSESTYSIVFSLMNEYNMSSYDVYVEELSSTGVTTSTGLVWHEKSTANWKTYYFNHTMSPNTVKVRLRFDNNGMQDMSVGTQDLLQIKNTMLILGSNLKPSQWYPRNEEIMSNITIIDSEGVKVKHNNINAYSQMSSESFRINKDNKDIFKVDANGLKILDSDIQVSHSDGSYTKMSYDGFKRYESGTSSTYHYYIKRGTVLLYSGESVNIEAPAHILQKEGVVLSVEQIVSPNTNSHVYSLNTMLVNSFFFDDYVKIQARLKWNNSSTQSVEEGGFIYVHYLIIG